MAGTGLMDRGTGRAADTKKVIGISTRDIHIHIPSWFPLPMSNTKCVIANRKDERWQIQVAERQSLRAEESERNLRGYCNNCRCINETWKRPTLSTSEWELLFLSIQNFCNNFSFYVLHKLVFEGHCFVWHVRVLLIFFCSCQWQCLTNYKSYL